MVGIIFTATSEEGYTFLCTNITCQSHCFFFRFIFIVGNKSKLGQTKLDLLQDIEVKEYKT